MAERTVLAKRHDQLFKKPKRGQDSSIGNVFCGNGNLMIPLTGSPLCLASFQLCALSGSFPLCMGPSALLGSLIGLASLLSLQVISSTLPSTLPSPLLCLAPFPAWPFLCLVLFSAWFSSLPGPLLCMGLFSTLSFLLPDTFF